MTAILSEPKPLRLSLEFDGGIIFADSPDLPGFHASAIDGDLERLNRAIRSVAQGILRRNAGLNVRVLVVGEDGRELTPEKFSENVQSRFPIFLKYVPS